jgi:hypothetical protein
MSPLESEKCPAIAVADLFDLLPPAFASWYNVISADESEKKGSTRTASASTLVRASVAAKLNKSDESTISVP